MDAVIVIVGIVLLVLFGPWILIWRANVSRRLEREQDQQRWHDLVSRISALEQAVEKFQTRPASREAPEPPPRIPQPRVTSVVSPPPPPPPIYAPSPPISAPATPISGPVSLIEELLEPAEPGTAKPLSQGECVVPPPPHSYSPPAPTLFSQGDRLMSSLDVEEMLGTNWLNKLGIVILVLGVSFFLAYQLKTLGPAGKVLVGMVTSGAMLGAGICFDRKERYRILARAGIGGGWALLFFTTYAMYHVAAAQVLQSQAEDLVLMFIVAAAMVAHTLRYRSQVVTGLAFLLAFLTVTISHSNVYSLSAGALLAAGLVVIVGRMQWFQLEIFGILASYLNHYLWLRPIIEPMHGKRHPFPEFTASAGLLLLYWLIFRASYVFRRPSDEGQERISTAAALLNTALLLALFKYQSLHPEWAFWALLAIGALETLLGQLPITRRRRTAVIVLSTLGVVLLLAAFPFRYSGARLSVLWLLEAEALLLIGVWTKEVVFRRLGMLASALVAGQMIGVDAARIYGRRMDGADMRADFALATVFVVAAAVFYANAHWVVRRWAEFFTREFDRRMMKKLSYAGAAMLLMAAWMAFPESWTAVAWCALGLGLMVAGRRFSLPELRYQANILGLVSVIRALAINLEATNTYHGLTLRLLTVSLVSLLLYLTSGWTGDGSSSPKVGQPRLSSGGLTAAYTWAASFLLALLAWYELRPVSVADAWMVGGLILLELGLTRRNLDLRLQGYALLAASFLRMFFVNLNASGGPGEISPRFYSVLPLGLAFFYAYWRLDESRHDLSDKEHKVPEVSCWLGTITFASLMRFELPADWVAGAWAALVFALLLVAVRSGKRIFLHQGLLVAVGVLFRSVLHNFYERSYFPGTGWENRWITAGTAIALLFASLPLAFHLRKRGEISSEQGLIRRLQWVVWRPEQLLFFIAVGLLTALLAIEMRHGMVTLSWGVEGVAVFLLALWLGERSFRLTGLGLLLLCAAKILLVDVWRLDPRDRYLTLMVLGAALLLVSFLYTRNRELLRQYL
ncbi:MAG TPA: DUF2339 domain-containing protein [Terriglobales bacterium]|nr:DUF2339 domain-containing protein [Terriglobales bacterium]